ncbi:MAG: SRPBCC family protein [Actinomycetes bacterium]
MEFTNEFTVPVGIERAFEVLTDLEAVAPCLPGATLEEVDGTVYTGKVKVKVGPIAVTYRGTAEMVEADRETWTARIDARGIEARGAGTATADVVARMRPDGDDRTAVSVTTDIRITGKPAQFGRGVMADVGARIIDTFAERLEELLEEDEAVQPPSPAPAPAGGPRQVAQPDGRGDDALDLLDVAGPAAVKRLAPLAALAAVVLVILWWRRRSGSR